MDDSTRRTMFSSASGEYQTPDWLFEPLNRRFRFTLDAAASHENHLVPMYYTKDGLYQHYFSTPGRVRREDGLTGTWGNPGHRLGTPAERSRVWLNPPYGRGVEEWVQKCAQERDHCAVIAVLLPARTETSWFHRWVAPYAEVHFLMGRVAFVGMATSAPFPNILAVYYPEMAPVAAGTLRAYTCDIRSAGEFAGGPDVH